MIFRKFAFIATFVIVVVVVVSAIVSVVLLIALMLMMTAEGSVILDRPVIAYRTPLEKPLRYRNVTGAHAIRRPLPPPSGRTRCTRLHINGGDSWPAPVCLVEILFPHHVSWSFLLRF